LGDHIGEGFVVWKVPLNEHHNNCSKALDDKGSDQHKGDQKGGFRGGRAWKEKGLEGCPYSLRKKKGLGQILATSGICALQKKSGQLKGTRGGRTLSKLEGGRKEGRNRTRDPILTGKVFKKVFARGGGITKRKAS